MNLSPLEREAISALSSRATLAAALFSALGDAPTNSQHDAQSLAKRAHRGVPDYEGAQQILDAGTIAGLFQRRGAYWVTPLEPASLNRLSIILAAVGHYSDQVHQDETTAQVVLTKPPKPSRLEAQLAKAGWRTGELELTSEAFGHLTASAERRVVVMTPFLDEAGAEWLQKLMEPVPPAVRKILILRHLDMPLHKSYPNGYPAIAGWLTSQGVEVYNYSLPRVEVGGRETFHAKIILCDEARAYVGSSNLNAASLEHSMELGIYVSGKAASSVGRVIDAVLAISNRFL